MRLFISYAHLDKSLVEPLVARLISGGHTPWIDKTDLRTGPEWRRQLSDAIHASDAIVLAISPAWLKSEVSQWEFVTAVEQGKQVVPVLIKKNEDGSNLKLPERISKYQWVDFTDGFTDENQVQEFLNHLHILGTTDQISKTKSEEHRTGEIKATNIGGIQVVTSKTENSPITITQTINHTNRRGSTILLIVIGIITALLAMLLLLPTGQRNSILNSVGISISSETPIPTITSTPAPEPMHTDQFSVVVAGFGYQQADGSVIQNTQSDDMSDVVSSSVSELFDPQHFRDWRSPGVGRILATDSDERGRQAATIAETLNASVVIYGLIRSKDQYYNSFEPEFYLSAPFAKQDTELVGSDKLGDPVDILIGSTEESGSANSIENRLKVLQLFLKGLDLYFQSDFTNSFQSFQDAVAIAPRGLEVLQILAGNAAVRANLSQEALGFYNAALIARPDYARALLGRGIVLFQMARNIAKENPSAYKPSLVLDRQRKCSDTNIDIPDSPQLLAELALRCYTEAGQSSDAPATADVDVKAAFGIGQVNVWRSLNGYGNHWDEVKSSLEKVIRLYENSSLERQARLKAIAGNANGWLGTRLVATAPSDEELMQQAATYFENAITLLTSDVNRSYNQQNINSYQQQYDAIVKWLNTRNGSAPLLAFTRTPEPTVTPTLELVG